MKEPKWFRMAMWKVHLTLAKRAAAYKDARNYGGKYWNQ